MEFINHQIAQEHQKWSGEFSEETDAFQDSVISIIDILEVFYAYVDFLLDIGEGDKFAQGVGPRDPKQLSSIVAHPLKRGAGGEDDYHKCADLFYGLVKNQPFRAYNKGAGLLAALYYLAKRGRAPKGSHKELEIITRIIASNTLRDRSAFQPYSKFEDGEIRFLAKYLSENTQPIDQRDYVITFMALNQILADFGFCLNNPQGDAINVCRIDPRTSLLGFGKKKAKYTKVGVMGFQGWNGGVSAKAMQMLRQCTGLSVADGFDNPLMRTRVLPISSLIHHYKSILILLGKK